MEFPRHLHKPGGLYVICPDESNGEALKARGWLLMPPEHVEIPVEVRLYDALLEDTAKPSDLSDPKGDLSLVADLSVEDAKSIILSADPVQLALIEAEELAGKNRKGILALIEVRKADHLGD